jgi:hypothetical protein
MRTTESQKSWTRPHIGNARSAERCTGDLYVKCVCKLINLYKDF